MISGLRFENLTAFEDLQLSLSPRINVIVGSNGTGKTHILKAIYGLGMVGQSQIPNQSEMASPTAISRMFLRVFSTELKSLGRLHAKGASAETRLVLESGSNSRIEVRFGFRSKAMHVDLDASSSEQELKPVFIPTKEVLSLVRGINHPGHDHATVEMIFDNGYIDLAQSLAHPGFDEKESGLTEDPRISSIIRELVALIGGRYRWKDNGTFSFEPGRYEEKADPARSGSKSAQAYQDSTVTRFAAHEGRSFSSGMTAEGYRKIGVLHRLLCNGSINPGTTGVLLWDEPEANLNPKLMKKLVQVLLELSRNGQQIILATHDYVLLKWLDLLTDKGKEDHVRFHALYRDPETQAISAESADSYSLISKTAISDTFAELFDEDMDRALGGVKS